MESPVSQGRRATSEEKLQLFTVALIELGQGERAHAADTDTVRDRARTIPTRAVCAWQMPIVVRA